MTGRATIRLDDELGSAIEILRTRRRQDLSSLLAILLREHPLVRQTIDDLRANPHLPRPHLPALRQT